LLARLSSWCQFVVYFAAVRLVRRLPWAVANEVGRASGLLSYLALPRRRRLAAENLELALPDRSAAERRRINRASFVHLGKTYWETTWAARLSTAEILRRVDVEGVEHLDAAAATGKGFFLLSGHYGAGDIAAWPLSQRLGPIHVVARDLRNPHIDRDVRALRRQLGMELIRRRGAGARALEVVRRGGRVALTIDQWVRPEHGYLLPFLGEPTWTSRLLAKLSAGSGLPVLPVYCLAEGARFRVIVEPPITPAGRGIDEEISLTRRYLESLENRIRRRPELWMWMQRRWRRLARLGYGPRFEKLTLESRLPPGTSAEILRSEQLPDGVRRRLRDLASGGFLERGESLVVVGPDELAGGVARGLGLTLARGGYPVAYRRLAELTGQLARAADRGRLTRRLVDLDQYPLLILDRLDEAAAPGSQELLAAVLEHRLGMLSTLLVQRRAAGGGPGDGLPRIHLEASVGDLRRRRRS
jgi:KDO2-lipid IV(A) lauroyltransferase